MEFTGNFWFDDLEPIVDDLLENEQAQLALWKDAAQFSRFKLQGPL